MPKFSANLSFFYLDRPLLERFAAAAKSGFKGVEFLLPYGESVADIQKALTENNLEMALFNSPSGDWDGGERGLGVVSGRDDEFAAAIATAIEYATAVKLRRVNVLAGIDKSGGSFDQATDRLVERLRYAADQFAKHGMTMLLEHINPFDMPGYFVSTPNQAIDILDRVGRDNAKLQYDVYHAQRMSGELVGFMQKHFSRIGHVQIADNPKRNQPGTGEINYKFVLDELDRLGYDGWVGLEYKPDPDADGSLGWITAMGYSL